MQRGEIYLVDLGPEFGRELGGVRPVVVASADFYNAVPFLVPVVIGEDVAQSALWARCPFRPPIRASRSTSSYTRSDSARSTRPGSRTPRPGPCLRR